MFPYKSIMVIRLLQEAGNSEMISCLYSKALKASCDDKDLIWHIK